MLNVVQYEGMIMQQSLNIAGNVSVSVDKIDKNNAEEKLATSQDITRMLQNNEDIRHLLKSASIAELESIAMVIRHRILEIVSKNGGHLSSTLGAVELIVGMHAVFDCTLHPFIYDVSHQAYAHKLLTGRYKEFETLRKINGISGFIAPYESKHDYFIAGHSSTSLSLAVGAAKAKKLNKDCNQPVVMIGDGSMSAGLVYEALNELGDLKLPAIIILNDNEMSIAKPIGAISKILSKTIASPLYQSMKEKVKKIVDKMPNGTTFIAKRFEESLKLITPGILFEEFGIDYIGPIDGNNIGEVINTLKSVQRINRPVLLHCQTIKGKGYKIAEGKYEKWHGVAPFDLSTGKAIAKSAIKSPTSVFSDTLLSMAQKDEKIVGVTAAMPSGTGLDKLMDVMPGRFFDVAIAEQHAVTSMAAMAKEGFKPYVAIYSTFLQRAFDQIVHDICIMNLPVVFCIDRAGIVGEDGETHQGLLDIAYLQGIPNMCLMSPRDNDTLIKMLEYSKDCNSPLALRYPRGQFALESCFANLNICEDLPNHHRQASKAVLLKLKDSKHYLNCMQKRQSQLIHDCLNENFTQDSKHDFMDNSRQEPTKDSIVKTSESRLNSSNEKKSHAKNRILLIGYGNGVGRMVDVWMRLLRHDITASLLDLVSLKPLDCEMITQCLRDYTHVFVMSDSYKRGGVGACIMQHAFSVLEVGKIDYLPKITSFELEDVFVRHGNTKQIEESLGIDSEAITRKILKALS